MIINCITVTRRKNFTNSLNIAKIYKPQLIVINIDTTHVGIVKSKASSHSSMLPASSKIAMEDSAASFQFSEAIAGVVTEHSFCY